MKKLSKEKNVKLRDNMINTKSVKRDMMEDVWIKRDLDETLKNTSKSIEEQHESVKNLTNTFTDVAEDSVPKTCRNKDHIWFKFMYAWEDFISEIVSPLMTILPNSFRFGRE